MPERQLYAAVDLGSNSFHLLIARLEHGQLRVLDRHKEMVRLAGGLDRHRRLDGETRQRALDCLARFGQRLAGIPENQVRAVGTQTFRKLHQPSALLVVAETALGFPIDIISGREEARLVYLGVSQGIRDDGGKRLVIDIGGGSTELVIGQGVDPLAAESIGLGCVSISRNAFGDGRISAKRWRRAEEKVRSELRPLTASFRGLGWNQAVGSSGTIRAVQAMVNPGADEGRAISRDQVEALSSRLIEFKRIDRIDLPGLSDRRQPVIAGGLLVLKACMDALDIDRLEVSGFALREGLLHDLLGRLEHSDPRDRTVMAMAGRYQCDQAQGERVRDFAMTAFEQVAEAWSLSAVHGELLDWSSRLHEMGLAISHHYHHLHGGYILEHADMPGFTRQEQQFMACLVRMQRRRIDPAILESLTPRLHRPARRLVVLLRLAICMARGRSDSDLPDFALIADGDSIELALPPGWLAGHPLTAHDLDGETDELARLGAQLTLTELPSSPGFSRSR